MRFIFAIQICLVALTTYAQEPSVEKSNFGVQLGIIGFFSNYEIKLSSQFTLRSEIGYEAYYINTNASNNSDKIRFAPVISAEPRWYYNLKKRYNQGKNIDRNSGNFVALKIAYHFINMEIREILNFNSPSVIPYWGFRKTWNKRSHYEILVGPNLNISNNSFTVGAYVTGRLGIDF